MEDKSNKKGDKSKGNPQKRKGVFKTILDFIFSWLTNG